jgi:hypothetical protein
MDIHIPEIQVPRKIQPKKILLWLYHSKIIKSQTQKEF